MKEGLITLSQEQLKTFNPNLEVKVDSTEYSDFEIQKLNWYSSNFKKTDEEFILLKPRTLGNF